MCIGTTVDGSSTVGGRKLDGNKDMQSVLLKLHVLCNSQLFTSEDLMRFMKIPPTSPLHNTLQSPNEQGRHMYM